jgi:hypothetical protein
LISPEEVLSPTGMIPQTDIPSLNQDLQNSDVPEYRTVSPILNLKLFILLLAIRELETDVVIEVFNLHEQISGNDDRDNHDSNCNKD